MENNLNKDTGAWFLFEDYLLYYAWYAFNSVKQ